MTRVREPAKGPPRLVWRTALAAGILGVVTLVATLTTSTGRDAVADFLGLGVEGEEISLQPTPAGDETPTPLPTPGDPTQYARESSLEEAARSAGFQPTTPDGIGPLREVYIATYADATLVVLRYPGVDIWQGDLAGMTVAKEGLPAPGGTIEEASVAGHAAYWITGVDRVVEFIDRQGTPVPDSMRGVTVNTLVWSADGRYYRVEGDLGRDEAIALGETITMAGTGD